jgi:hypothetical protein
VEFKERLAEACRECRCRFCDTAFRTCELGCKAGEEVVLSLFRCKNGNRRKNTECVCGKEDYVLCVGSSRNRANDLFDVVDGVRNTCVFCYRAVCEIAYAVCINSNVFKKSVAFDCSVDIGFGFFVEVDNLSVAATFAVEDTVIVRSLFVVAGKKTIGVCR